MAISQQDVAYVAKLAKLQLTPEEEVDYGDKLNQVLQYMEQLQELDTANIPAMTQVLAAENVFREDELKPGLTNKQALANAPDSEDGYFRVPKIV